MKCILGYQSVNQASEPAPCGTSTSTLDTENRHNIRQGKNKKQQQQKTIKTRMLSGMHTNVSVFRPALLQTVNVEKDKYINGLQKNRELHLGHW